MRGKPPTPIIPRERIYGKVPKPLRELTLDERRDLELRIKYADGWADGYRAGMAAGRTEVLPHIPPPTSMTAIANQVADKHGVSLFDMKSVRRHRPSILARQEFAYRCRYETSFSLGQIGHFLGGRDHSTILYAISRPAERFAGASSRTTRVTGTVGVDAG